MTNSLSSTKTTTVNSLHPDQVLTTDGVPLKVDAVVFYRVVDPSLCVIRAQNGYQATHTLAQTTLRATLGVHTLKEALMQRMALAQRMEVSEMLPCLKRTVLRELALACASN